MKLKLNFDLSARRVVAAALLLELATITSGVAAQKPGPLGLGNWANWGRAAGAQHAAVLTKEGREITFVACGVRATLELTSKAKKVTAQQREVFLAAFDSTCLGDPEALATSEPLQPARR